METSEFIRKVCSRYLWGNFIAMGMTVFALAVVSHFAMNFYTHHGESITIPNVKNASLEKATEDLEDLGMIVEVKDSGYNKNLPSGTVLEQLPAPGTIVKSGRTIYLTINSFSTPTLMIPDVINNCSLREAKARLSSLGFKLGPTEYVSGEKDWVYGIKANGKNVNSGSRVSKESIIIIQAGNSQRDSDDDVTIVDMPEGESEDFDFDTHDKVTEISGGDADNFEVVE